MMGGTYHHVGEMLDMKDWLSSWLSSYFGAH
jgi:hypothetical protein